MKNRWRMLSFRAGLLSALAVGLLGIAAAFLLGRDPLAALVLFACAAGIGLAGWLCILRPYRAQERATLLFLEGYTPPRSDAACALSPAQARLQEQVAAILNPEQLFNLNKRQAQYQALQNQINPHFLYNTLESIRGEALLSGMDTIADMTEALATFFRYTISKVENLVSVEEELQNCETYFHIQRYRFADRLVMHIQCDPADREAIYRCRMPKLTIQPIVENSIIHGTELKLGTGHIRIQLERTQKRLLIRISDDGVGMDAETLFRLNERLGKSAIAQPPQSRGGLALANVDSRIRLLFGDKYGLHAFSTPGVGTDVEITLPMIASDREIPNREALL